MTDRPLVLVRGGATAEEVAAVVALLLARSSAPAAPAATQRSRWGVPVLRGRPAGLVPGPGAWRASALPR